MVEIVCCLAEKFVIRKQTAVVGYVNCCSVATQSKTRQISKELHTKKSSLIGQPSTSRGRTEKMGLWANAR